MQARLAPRRQGGARRSPGGAGQAA